jgi:hypothetical protein
MSLTRNVKVNIHFHHMARMSHYSMSLWLSPWFYFVTGYISNVHINSHFITILWGFGQVSERRQYVWGHAQYSAQLLCSWQKVGQRQEEQVYDIFYGPTTEVIKAAWVFSYGFNERHLQENFREHSWEVCALYLSLLVAEGQIEFPATA